MSDLSPNRPRLGPHLAICASAMAVGWGIVGVTGGIEGAALPGILCALAIALVSSDDHKRNRVAALAVAGGLGTSIGGALAHAMSTSWLIALGTWHAIALLAAQGILLGGFAGGSLGIALSPIRYRRMEVGLLVLIGIAYLAYPVFWNVSINYPIYKTIPFALILFLFWLALIKRDRVAFFVAVAGMVGFGLGAGFGLGLMGQVWDYGGSSSTVRITWLVMGLCGGTALALSTFTLDEDLVRPSFVRWGWATCAGFAYVVWWAPAAMADMAVVRWARLADPPLPLAVWAYRGGAVTLLLLCILVLAGRLPVMTAAGATAAVFLWVGTSCVALEFLRVFTPSLEYYGFSGTDGVIVALWLFLVGYALLRSRTLADSANE